jgi:hypothetical protein
VANIGAPYLCDFLTFTLFFVVCMLVFFKRRWIWLNLIALGIISPLVNSYYNYTGGLRGPNDVGKLLKMLPDGIVHGYFWWTISAYAVGLVVVFSLSRTAVTQHKPKWRAGQPFQGVKGLIMVHYLHREDE